MDVCVVLDVRTVAWNVKWHEGRKDLNSTKIDQRGKNPDRQKKKKIPPGAWMFVLCLSTSWSLVQRSPTDCGVSQMCVIVKPRRNEEAQAHIGLSTHTKKKTRWAWVVNSTPRPLYPRETDPVPVV
jgi:hypothetical protein